jgi:ubiquinone/menaquinone biosynthesis C-methylase UbiE
MKEGYIHGYSRREQQRLLEQARVLAPQVFAGLELGGAGRLLEIGCGVGAELDLIHRRWPRLQLTGVDRSRRHLVAARDLLAPLIAAGRARLVQADGARLPFAAERFERVITVWLLEHVPDPERVLAEALRVLTPDGELVCVEVDNRCFGFSPELPAIAHWWRQLNAHQQRAGGHPFIGGSLAHLATRLGARGVRTENLAVISSQRDPLRRETLLRYLEDLLRSAAPSLLAEGAVTPSDATALQAAFATARSDPTVEFRYFAVRLRCRARRAAP